jgi:hypothetical protein
MSAPRLRGFDDPGAGKRVHSGELERQVALTCRDGEFRCYGCRAGHDYDQAPTGRLPTVLVNDGSVVISYGFSRGRLSELIRSGRQC